MVSHHIVLPCQRWLWPMLSNNLETVIYIKQNSNHEKFKRRTNKICSAMSEKNNTRYGFKGHNPNWRLKKDELWANAHLWYPRSSAQEVGIWRVKKRFPRYGVPIWSLWPNIRFLPSIVAEKIATKNEHIQCRCNVYKYQQSRQTGSRNTMGP